MGILDRLQSDRIKNLSVTSEKAWNPSLWNLQGAKSLSGETVTEETVLTYGAVWNAVNLYAGAISTLPLHLLRKKGRNTVHEIEEPLYRVLHDRFNPYMDARIGREVMMSHVLLWGNAYAEIVRNGFGEVTSLWPITPNRIRPVLKDSVFFYEVQVDTDTIPMSFDKILHIPGLGFDGLQGYSVVAMARKSLGLGMALDTFGALYFGQGTHLGRVFSHPSSLSDKARGNLEKSLAGTHEGLAKAHKIIILEEGMKTEKIGIPPEDSQFLESRQFQIADVARWFNLPPHKLKDLSKSSFNNIESEQLSYVIDSILPWLVRFEQGYNCRLLTEKEQYKKNMFFRHNVDGMLRGSPQTRAEYYRVMFNIGAMSINDIREKEGWDAVEGGDERFIPLNMFPLSKIEQYTNYISGGRGALPGTEPETKPVEPAKNLLPFRKTE